MIEDLLPASEVGPAIEAIRQKHASVIRRHRRWNAELQSRLVDVRSTVPWYPLAASTSSEMFQPAKSLSYATGGFYLQDAGSLLAPALVGGDAIEPSHSEVYGKWVCDLCAAPGGKASAMLEAIGPGFLLANEPIATRLGPLAQNLERVGSPRYAICKRDPDDLADTLGPIFDVVLVDAPCSGQAMVAVGKQSESSNSATMVAANATRQRRILNAAVRLLVPGGILVYSTCTYARDENEAQIERLVDAGIVEATRCQELEHRFSEHGLPISGSDLGYRIWPHLHGAAGAFAAKVRITNAAPVQGSEAKASLKRNRSSRQTKHLDRRGGRQDRLPACDSGPWGGRWPGHCRMLLRGDKLLGWPSDAPEWVESVAGGGPTWATLVGKTFKPGTAWLSSVGQASAAKVLDSVEDFCLEQDRLYDLDDDSAIALVSGQSIRVDATLSGWHLATWRGRPLGWIKATRGVGKNHRPAANRMRDVAAV
ncbi:MAG: SAM-dependent methyltransferase [Planctomycetota bacterium]